MYNKEFKAKVIKYRLNHSEKDTAEHFNIHKSLVYRWSNPEKRKTYNKKANVYQAEYAKTHKKEKSEYDKQWYEKNKEERKQCSRQYWHDNKDECMARRKKWKGKNKAHMKAYNDEYRRSHREERKEWIKNNPNKMKQYYENSYDVITHHVRKRRAKKASVNENFTPADVEYTKKLFGNKCAICNKTEDLQIDHWYPLSKGYPLTRSNAVLMCKSCNCSKGDKLPKEHYEKDVIKRVELILESI
jgi:hypothetical protein